MAVHPLLQSIIILTIISYIQSTKVNTIPIIISKDNETRKIEESKFEAETKLQKYIYNNPEILPIEEIEEEIPFIIAAREVPTNSGPIDAVGLDKNGNIYVIETKLYSNSDKRKIMQVSYSPLPTIPHKTPKEHFSALLKTHQAVLVTKNREVIGMITAADLL